MAQIYIALCPVCFRVDQVRGFRIWEAGFPLRALTGYSTYSKKHTSLPITVCQLLWNSKWIHKSFIYFNCRNYTPCKSKCVKRAEWHYSILDVCTSRSKNEWSLTSQQHNSETRRASTIQCKLPQFRVLYSAGDHC